MQYSMGDCLAESGFQFYEKLHEPIFLLSNLGGVLRANQAGRKLLGIARITAQDIEESIQRNLGSLSQVTFKKTVVLGTRNKRIHIALSKLLNSEYFLIEIRR